MKRTSLVKTVLLMLTCLSLLLCAQAADYGTGYTITFGSYPQSAVTDSACIAALDAQGGDWVSFGYDSHAKKAYTDFMQYKDVVYEGEKYRAVRFSSREKDGAQDSPNQVDWFRYEPVQWRVLDATDPENALVLSVYILDSQAFRDTYYVDGKECYTDSTKTFYANNYAASDIRTWLNGEFYETIFSAAEQKRVKVSTLENKAHPDYSRFDAEPVSDKVFLLSYAEAVCEDYGFCGPDENFHETVARQVRGSDYAKALGLADDNGSSFGYNSDWWLRSGGVASNWVCYVNKIGQIYNASGGFGGTFERVDDPWTGVRAALRMDLTVCDADTHAAHSWTLTGTQEPECLHEGRKTYLCGGCGAVLNEPIPALGHDFVNDVCTRGDAYRMAAKTDDAGTTQTDAAETTAETTEVAASEQTEITTEATAETPASTTSEPTAPAASESTAATSDTQTQDSMPASAGSPTVILLAALLLAAVIAVAVILLRRKH